MIKAKIIHLDKLLELLSEKTKQPLTHKGFKTMSEIIGNVEKRYLYESISLRKQKAISQGETRITLQGSSPDYLAKYLGYVSYRDFAEQMDDPISDILSSCAGYYYSYVRQNDDQGFVLQSPVKIELKDGKAWFELRGNTWIYRGELRLMLGCLFVLMHSKVGKMIHHVYRIGVRENPIVLQGIFSGISTTSDPIGGRAVLIRSTEDFSKLKNEKLEVTKLIKSENRTLRGLGQYFSTREGNNLAIYGVGMTFGLDDLHTPHIQQRVSTKKKVKINKSSSSISRRSRQ